MNNQIENKKYTPQVHIKNKIIPMPPVPPPKCVPKTLAGYPKQKPPYIVEIDPTFEKSGAAADAKLTGALVSGIIEDLGENYLTAEETIQKIQEEILDTRVLVLDGNDIW